MRHNRVANVNGMGSNQHTTNTLVDVAAVSVGVGAEMGYGHVTERQTGRKVDGSNEGKHFMRRASSSLFNVAIRPKTGAKGYHIRKRSRKL